MHAPCQSAAGLKGHALRLKNTDEVGCASRCGWYSRHKLSHQRPQISKAIGLCPQHDDGNIVGVKVLLKGEVAVHRDEDVEVPRGERQQRAIGNTGPAIWLAVLTS